MIIYFANWNLDILGQATTELNNTSNSGVISDDKKVQDLESGITTFDVEIPVTDENRGFYEALAMPGNYVMRHHDTEDELYTIVDHESDTDGKMSIYTEDAGLDLLNGVALKNPDGDWSSGAKTLTGFFTLYLKDTGFKIGLNEAINDTTTKQPNWSGESSIADRLKDIAHQFGYEIGFSYEINDSGFYVNKMLVNIYKKRGKDTEIQLRLGKDVEKIITKRSVANLATSLLVVGGSTASGEPQTLTGYTYSSPDNDFKVETQYFTDRQQTHACLVSPKALNEYGKTINGEIHHITKVFNSEHTNKAELAKAAAEELTKCCKPEENYDISLVSMPTNLRLGDRLHVIDGATDMVVSSRVLKIETSVTNDKITATLGDEKLIESNSLISHMQTITDGQARLKSELKARCKPIQSGIVVGSNVPSGSYKNFNVTFPEAFGTAPDVMVCLKSASTSSGMGKVSCSAINESKTGFTIRAFNGDSTGREPDYRWIAVAKD